MDRLTRLPDHLLEAAQAFAEGTRTPVEPRPASTVVLLREGAGALEVYLLRRHSRMAFAAGMCVFPGGGVDQRDHDDTVGWAGPTPAQWALRMGLDEPRTRALVCAAVRETFEESGVLLAGPSAREIVEDTTGADWEADRTSLESGEASLTEVLARRGLVLRSDLLALWGSWVTPVFEPRRYDTQFFVARLPAGQVTRDVSTESESVLWLSLAEAIARVDAEEIAMMPPTYVTCTELAGFASVEAALAAATDRDLTPVRPQLVVRDGAAYLSTSSGPPR